MKSRVPRKELLQVRRTATEAQTDVAKEYMLVALACTVTGMSQAKVIKFCSEHDISHMKYKNQWVVHRQQLLDAYQKYG